MFRVVTAIHDPAALAAACRETGLPPPWEGLLRLCDQEVSGHVVRLPGLRFPVAFDTVTGLVAYHPADNAPVPYAQLMHFVASYYAVRARPRYQGDVGGGGKRRRCRRRRAGAA